MRILYIDDDNEDQEIFRQAMQRVQPDAEVFKALSGDQAFQLLLREMKPLPDYIFLDLNMPGKDGKQFLIEMKMNQRLKKIPVIIYTTSRNPQDNREMMQLGAIDFITKRETFFEICQCLQNLL